MAKCGIYKYTNLINGKVYIGQAIDINQRKREHRCNASKAKKGFEKALQKYGEDNFSFEIIEECNKNELDKKEIYWISYYHSYIKDPLCNGYNLTPGGKSGQGTVFKKPVEQYDLYGNFIQEYESASEAARQLNLFKSNITAACRGETSQCGGYQWKYKNDISKIEKIKYIGIKKVEQYDYLGNLLKIYDSAKEASENNNICHQSITACCRHEIKFAGDFQWRYENDLDKQITMNSKGTAKLLGQYDKNWNLIKIYKSISEAGRESNFCRESISRHLDKQTLYKGYYWKKI